MCVSVIRSRDYLEIPRVAQDSHLAESGVSITESRDFAPPPSN